MNLKNYRSVFPFLMVVFLVYVLHKIVFYTFSTQLKTNDFKVSLEFLYLIFTSISIVIFIILIIAKKKTFDNVGMIFMILTTLKTVLCGVFLSIFFVKVANGYSIQKMNFFVIFMLFLAIETLFTIRILNNK